MDEFLSPNGVPINGRREGSKAHKILGTADVPIKQHDHGIREEKKRGGRPSFLRTPDIISKKPNFVPFPSSAVEESQPPQHLRVRASSPLLGHGNRPQDPSPPSTRKPWKKIHQAGSSSALYSYFNPRDSTITTDSQLRPETAPEDDAVRVNTPPENVSKPEQSIRFREQKTPAKESKRKLRPPRIDLSLLFPRPRANAAPLLSPQRMTNSPSQLSLASEASARRADGKRPATTPIAPTTIRRPSEQALSETSDKENSGWPESSLQRTVRTSEFDLALDQYDQLQRKQTRSTDRTIGRMTSNSSTGGWSRERYLSPPSQSHGGPNRVSHTSGTWPGEQRRERSASDKRPISKKSSRSTLQNSDLNTSSVLCLSSSEDEDEAEEPANNQLNGKSHRRGSMVSYGDFEPEVCTASAAHSTKPALRRVDRNISAGHRPRAVRRNQSVHRNPSMSSYASRRSHSRRSSGVQTYAGSEAQCDRGFGNQYLSPRETNRRSRVMTVTKQEEHLLEAMRRRRGKLTPSLYIEARSTGLDAEQMSMLSVPSRESFYSTDMSFLRLSPSLPPLRTDQSAPQSDKEGLSSQGTSSDTEHKTINSTTSPRASLAYTESLPSPATSGASPLTPTLPIHRFSPLPSQKPPPRQPLPPLPHQEQRRHSRRRTDSSGAIVLDEADEDNEQEDFPIWAYGLDNIQTGVAAAH